MIDVMHSEETGSAVDLKKTRRKKAVLADPARVDPGEVFDDPQVRHRQMALDLDVDGATALNPGVAIKLSNTPGGVRFPTPVAGSHTDEILDGLGYSGAEIEQLRAAGAV